MPAILGENRYGKSRVRVMKVTRRGPVHTVAEWNVEVWLEGEFTNCFEHGDNSRVLPTDTMKNTVYSLARASEAVSIEEFAGELVTHFLAGNPHVKRAGASIHATLWEPLQLDDQAALATFTHKGSQNNTTTATFSRDSQRIVTSGFDNLWLLKTARSAFAGFMKDNLTTLKETHDRLLGTLATANWTYKDKPSCGPLDYNDVRQRVTTALIRTFAEHESLSVQQTLYAMAEAALKQVEEIVEVHLSLPNKHCNLVDLSPFGQDNPNMIFVPTDEPHGSIEAHIRRSK